MLFRMSLQPFNLEICIVFLLCVEFVFCFNLDTTTPIVHSGPKDSYFGYSLSGYSGFKSNWLIIGAPKAQTNQTGVTEGGSVFKCSPAQSGDCTRLVLDRDDDGNELGNTYKNNPRSDSETYQFDEKSYQLFGATIESSRVRGGPLLACAPKYTWHHNIFSPSDNPFPIGRCFAATDDLQVVTAYTPCYTTEDKKQSLVGIVYGQAGLSAAIPNVNDFENDFLVGAVGTGFSQGSGVKLNFRTDAKAFTATDITNIRLEYNYKGYSLDFINMNNAVRYVVGAPRAEKLFGVVYVFPNTIHEGSLQEFKGDQFGAYFGQSLIVVDLNGDGYEDIVVGAPLYANNDKWECGRIYIYYQDPRIDFKDPVKITGQRIRSRFGYSLAGLGDINADGYDDLGVGAPYDGEDGAGVVYIYQGQMSGISTEASQVITPVVLNLNVTSFGAALSGGIDVDNNTYPDVVVGAYQSDKAVLLRSRPVITVKASVESLQKGINLENKDLQLPGKTTLVTSYLVIGCLQYTGINVPNSQEFIVTLTLDQNQPAQSRTVFMTNSSSEVRRSVMLNAGQEKFCIHEKAYIQDDIADIFNPIIIMMTYVTVEQADVALFPILNQNSLSATSQAYFLNSCKNNICIPDLSIEAKSLMDTVTIGDKKGLGINVTVENRGEIAFSSILRSSLPTGFGLIGIRRPGITDIFIVCDFDENQLECDIGNPLPAKKTIKMMLYLSVDELIGDTDILDFVLSVESLNPENQTTLDNNNAQIQVSVKVSATIELKGISIPEQVTFDEDIRKDESEITSENAIGPVVSHIYEVLNHGPSRVGMTDVEITWPMKTTTGEYLFYLTKVTTNMGDICSVSGGVDPKNLTMIQSQHTYSNANRITRDISLEMSEPVVSPNVEPKTHTIADCSEGLGCVNVTCRAHMIVGGASLIITLQSRLWVNTLLKNNIKETFATSSAFSRVLSMPYLISPDVDRQDSLEITTDVNPAIPSVGVGEVEIWIIIVAIIGGLLLLLLLAAILYKLGFFKRKTIPTDENNGPGTEADDCDGEKNVGFE